MKIAITGDTKGIGAALRTVLEKRGHEIVGLSRSSGYDITRITPDIIERIEPCDLFINNAQTDFAQTRLLYKIWRCWAEHPEKTIWNISTILTLAGITGPPLITLDPIEMNIYRNQKLSLEDAHNQLKFSKYGGLGPKMCLIKPGNIKTKPEKERACDVDLWAEMVVNTYEQAYKNNMLLEEISIGWLYNSTIEF